MRGPFARPWGVRGLLLLAAAVPTLVMLVVIAVAHFGSGDRIRVALEERATLVASALAEASEYGLISGNPAALVGSPSGMDNPRSAPSQAP